MNIFPVLFGLVVVILEFWEFEAGRLLEELTDDVSPMLRLWSRRLA